MNPETSCHDVARGADGQLFLVGGNQHVLDYVQGTRVFLEGAKRIFRDNLRERRKYCDKLGIRFAHIACPDKHTVLDEQFPFEIKVPVGKIMWQYCDGLLVFPVEELKKIGDARAYLRTDTHWSIYGQMEFVRQALKGLEFPEGTFEANSDEMASLQQFETSYCGDLGNKLQPREYEDRYVFRTPTRAKIYTNKVSGSNGAIFVAINKTTSQSRLLLFADSFAISCLSLLSLSFKEVLVVRSPFFHRELVDLYAPSHVLTSNVERYLPNMPTDKEAPIALLMANLLKKDVTKADEDFYQALNAVLQPGTLHHDRFLDGLG